MDVFVARQPIFTTDRKIYAYELLFRSGETNGFPDIDGETATTSLLSSSFFTVGVEKISGGKLVFINFTEELIKKGTPQLFSPKQLMVEILEDVTPSEEIISACKELKEKGFELALDDFVYSRVFDELLQLSDIIKIDFRLTPMEQIKEMITSFSDLDCRLLAEKIETYEEFNAARELGFVYFQGYFFSKPEVLRNKDLSASQLSIVQLISQINTAEFDVEALEKLVSQDVSITYKLLNYINSAHFARIQPVTSISQAISFLGEREFKLFVTLIATSKLSESKPEELFRVSLIRARFLELIGKAVNRNSSELFLLGLFSHIDAMLDRSIESILDKLSLSENIQTALRHRSGELFQFLRLVETYQTSNWVGFRFARKNISVSDETITSAYLEAIAWADSFI